MSKVDLSFSENKKETVQKQPPTLTSKGSVAIKEKGPFKRFVSNFVKNDIRTVAGEAVDNVLLPDGAELFVGVLEYIIEGIFLGGDRSIRKSMRGGDVPYNAIFKSGKKFLSSVKEQDARKAALSYEEVIFTTYELAQEVLDDMYDYIDNYKVVSVLDLYSFIKERIENPECLDSKGFTDDDYGWKDLTGAKIRPVRGGGFVLNLPRPRYIK